MASNASNSSGSRREQVGSPTSFHDEPSMRGANENTLCDIIAQQREFQLQLRQESVTATRFGPASGTAAAASRPGGRFAPLNQRQMTMMATSGEHAEQFHSPSKQAGGRQQARRKFSLSAAMSNLASFATSSQQQQHQQQQQQQSIGSMGAPVRPPRRARDSVTEQQVEESAAKLVDAHQLASSTGEFRSASAMGSMPPPVGSPPTPTPTPTANTAEKKRGLVHKAIRRGSKMFDSMLLRQSQAAAGEQPGGSDSKTSTSVSRQNSCDGHPVTGAIGAGGSSTARVQFATSIEKLDKGGKKNRSAVQVNEAAAADEKAEIERAIRQLQQLNKQDQEDDDQTFRRRRRKLRLGSIPHDLRRALSLGGAHAHHHNKNSSELRAGAARRPPNARVGDEQHPEELSGEERAADELAALRLKHETAASKPANNSTSSASSSSGSIGPRAASSSKLTGSQLTAAASGGRLKRKNSLFAPLTNVAFHYHSSSRHKEHSAEKQQAALSPSKVATGATSAASNSQSASFSLCQDHSRTYKLIIFGSSAVGKTSLIQRFLYGHFPATHKPTVEELHSNKYNIPELGEIYLEILDTSGTFEFPAMRRLSIEKGDAFILVFSAADEASWLEVQHLRGLILEEKTGSSTGSSAASASTSIGNGQLPTVGPTQAEPQQQQQQQPLSSVYAAATRLTAASRRTSSSPALGKGPVANVAPTPQRPAANSPLAEAAGELPSIKSQYSNSQFSKVLSERARDRADDDDDDDDDEPNDTQEVQTGATNNQVGDIEQRQQLRQQHALVGGPPIVVVANKCDLDTTSHQVDLDEAERLVRDQWGNSFVCCSAKEALNIDRVFKELLRQARAPEVLSQFVIDDHQQRRQSLPVLKNQLSAHHVKGLRNLYNQQQQQAAQVSGLPTRPASQLSGQVSTSPQQPQQARDVQLALGGAQDDGQCAIM